MHGTKGAALRWLAGAVCGAALIGACRSGVVGGGAAPFPGASTPPAGPSLVTGRSLSFEPESSQDVGSMPMNIALSPDGAYAIVSDIGWHQWLWSVRTSDGKGVSNVRFTTKELNKPDVSPGGENVDVATPSGSPKTNGLYYGLAIAKDGTVYAAQGAHDSVAVLSLGADGALAYRGELKTGKQDFPAGLALDNNGRLYVANNAAADDDPYKLTASVAVYDTRAQKELGRYAFKESYGGTSNFPFGIAVLGDGSKAYVASERDDAVYVLDTREPSSIRVLAKLDTGSRPVCTLLSKDQKRLYVSNSLSDTVSAVDTRTDAIVGTALVRPKMARQLCGTTPTGLALSPDQKTLYAALSDMNAAAVIDSASMELRAYIPAGWYPTAMAVTPDGKRLLVANAKGTSVRNPSNKPNPHEPNKKTSSLLSVLVGNVTSVRIPRERDLRQLTEQVIADNRLDRLEGPRPNPLADIGLAAGKIKHVIYIVKENRTYDQVLGDLARGNGDPSLTLFGRDVTPNQHALAERFVLLDNLYVCGEVSGDGWCWSTEGMANAYVQRNVPYNYSGRGRKFDFEGHNNGYPTGGFPAKDENGKPLATNPSLKDGAKPIPDVASTGVHIWDAARTAGVSLRNYGFYLFTADHATGLPGGPDNYPVDQGLQPPGHDLAGVSDWDFRRFDMGYPDSDGPQVYFEQTGDEKCRWPTKKYGAAEAPSRFSEWNREFRMMLAKDPSGGAVPGLMLVRFCTDHTNGAAAGKHTPRSYVADNDYAVGQLVDAVSKSPVWESTAIFVIEDDAQNGVDHVDAHRTIGFVISPWIKAGSVDHRFYNTDSMLKTIELLLGLPALSQYDAVADPILDWDSRPSNAAPFAATLPAKEVIADVVPPKSSMKRGDPRLELARRTEAMDFSHADAAPAYELNQIIWKTVRGTSSEMPLPRGIDAGEEDDD
jgi:DNA-binding beta-propeller fold protein YncE